ncbi:MAG: C80 family cysteine peptidase, partial [Desulfobacterales bacterium]|nr:C80 family cysteine peptidase [Desulfobacterales bacterium]
MPAQDQIYQPVFSSYLGRSVLIVIPGALIDAVGEEVALARAAQVSSYLELLANSDPEKYDVGLGIGIVSRLRAILNGSAPAEVRPETVGELLDSFAIPGATNPDIPIPPEVSLVIYLDPKMTSISARSSLYRKSELVNTGRTGMGLIAFNGNTPIGAHGEVIPYLLAALYRISDAVNGHVDTTTQSRAWLFSELVAQSLNFPDIDPDVLKDIDFIHTDAVDRVGLELEVSGTQLTALNGAKLKREMILGYTDSNELGVPVFRLKLDNLIPPSGLGWAPEGFHFPELVVAPLTTWEYASPEVHIANKVLLAQFQDVGSGISMREVLERYNRALQKELGGAWVRYALKPNERAPLDNILVKVRPRTKPVYSGQVTLLMPYERIGTYPFFESLGESKLNAYMGHVFVAAKAFLARLKLPSEEMTPEFEAFAFQLFFDEMQRKVAGGERATKLSYKLLFRFSREDVVYSILSDNQVRFLASWFEKPGNRLFLQSVLTKAGLPSSPDTPTWGRVVNILDVTAKERIETGRAQLAVDAKQTDVYSPVPDESGRQVLHSHPFAESRRRFVEKNGRYYVGVEYRSRDNPIVKLATEMQAWMESRGLENLRALVEGTFVPDAYARAASLFFTSSEAIVAGEESDAQGLKARVLALMESVPQVPPDLDDKGRIAPVNEGWWRAVYQSASRLQEKARDVGEEGLAQHIGTVVGQGFHVDLDVPLPRSGAVTYRGGRFFTWRGEVSASELGLPEGWRPGDSIPGYEKVRLRHGVTHYTSQGDPLGLPFDFSLTWNGLSWPVEAMHGLPHASSMASEKVQISVPVKQLGTSLALTLEIPEGGRRLGGDGGTLFGYTVDELDGVLVVVNALDYLAPEEGVVGEPMKDWAHFRRALVVLSHTESGREILNKIAALPKWSAEPFQGVTLAGYGLDEVFDGRRWRMVVQLGKGSSMLKLLPTPGTSEVLPVLREGMSRYRDSLTFAALSLGRHLGSVAEGLGTRPIPSHESPPYYLAKEKLRIENRIAFELGAPFRARVSSAQVEVLVPLDGSVPLVDEAYDPISPEKLRELTLINRFAGEFLKVAQTIDANLDGWPFDYDDPGGGVYDLMEELESKIEAHVDQAKLIKLLALKRQIQEKIVRLGWIEASGTSESYRRGVSEVFPTSEEMTQTAMDGYASWMARMESVLGDGEMTALALSFLDRELRGLKEGYRDPWDIKFLLKDRPVVMKDYLLSRLIELGTENPGNPYYAAILNGEEDAVADATERGGLSYPAKHALVMGIERNRLDLLNHFTGDFSEALILSRGGRRFMLENRARPSAIYVSEDGSGALSREDRGYYDTEFMSVDEGRAGLDTLSLVVKGWADQFGQSPEKILYEWTAQVLAERGVENIDGSSLSLYVAVVRDPDHGEVVGLAIGQLDERGWLRIEGLLSNPQYHDPNSGGGHWVDVESEAMISFVRAGAALYPDAKMVFEARSGRSYRVGLENYFFPAAEAPEEDEFSASDAETARSLQMQRGASLRELAYAIDAMITQLGPDGLTPSLSRLYGELLKKNSVFQEQMASGHSAEGQDPGVYYRFRQAMTDFVVELSEYVRSHPEIQVTHLEEIRQLLEQTAPHPDPVTLGVRYADTSEARLIVQLEDDPVVEEAARSLYGKNARESQWVRLDSDGQLRTVEGRRVALDQGSRVLLVGHGTVGRLAGLSAQNIIDALMSGQVFEGTSEIRRISLVAPSTDDPDTQVVEGPPGASFARELLRGLDRAGVRVGSISTRAALVSVDQAGRKWIGIPDAKGRVVWSQKNSAIKRIDQWGEDGEIVTSHVPVEQGLVRVVTGGTAYRPVSDAMVAAYGDMLSRVSEVTLSDGITGAHGTAADFLELMDVLILRNPELVVRALGGVAERAEAGILDVEVADAVGGALASMREEIPRLVDSVLVALGDDSVEALGRSMSEEMRPFWDQSLYGDQMEVETLVQTGRGEGLEHQGASSAERAASRLVWLQKGVVVDAYGLPVVEGTPGDLTASERVRVVAELGSDYSGRIRISPQHVAEEPVGDLIEENPELAHLPDENWAPFVPEE